MKMRVISRVVDKKLQDNNRLGAHICSLLLTFFLRYMPQLIENGCLYLAKMPLYNVQLNPNTKSQKEQYCYSDEERDKYLLAAQKSNTKYHLLRYKGLIA